MKEGKENKKYKQKTKGWERPWSILCANNGRHLEVILNTVHEIPVMPTAFIAGDECKSLHLLACELVADGNSQLMTKTKD